MAVHNYVLISLVGLVPVLASMVWMLVETLTKTDLTRAFAFHSQKQCSRCESGYFCLQGLEKCHPVLDCIRIRDDIVMKEIIGRGAVKLVIFKNILSKQYLYKFVKNFQKFNFQQSFLSYH